MAVLRDITAKLGLQLDKGSFKKADKAIDGLSASLGGLARVVVGGAALLGVGKLITLASDANETLNVLNENFGASSKAVQKWSKDFGRDVGRSEFAMREMAGELGSVLTPMMEGNGEAAAGMSVKMAELAVDLGSFFNKSEQMTLQNLISGFTGGTEALFKYGIIMTEANLKQFALSQGITKNIKDLTSAEKTLLKYNFVLAKTAKAQGDAKRTSEGWANVSKALLSSLKNLATRVGLRLLPGIEKLAQAARDITNDFLDWEEGTQILKASLIVVGTVATAIAVRVGAAWALANLPILGFALAVAIAAFVLDDFFTLMDGGDSVIGEFIDSIFGPGSAANAVDHLWEAWDRLNFFWTDSVIPAMEKLGATIHDVSKALGVQLDHILKGQIESWGLFFDEIAKGFKLLSKLGFDFGVSLAGDSSQRSLAAPTTAAPILQSLPGQNMSIDNTVNVTLQGDAGGDAATRVGDATLKAMQKANRRARAALTQVGGT